MRTDETHCESRHRTLKSSLIDCPKLMESDIACKLRQLEEVVHFMAARGSIKGFA